MDRWSPGDDGRRGIRDGVCEVGRAGGQGSRSPARTRMLAVMVDRGIGRRAWRSPERRERAGRPPVASMKVRKPATDGGGWVVGQEGVAAQGSGVGAAQFHDRRADAADDEAGGSRVAGRGRQERRRKYCPRKLLPLGGGARVAVADGVVEFDRFYPAVRIVVAHRIASLRRRETGTQRTRS